MSLKFNLVFSLAAIASFGFSENSEAQIFRSGPNCCCSQPVVRAVQPTCPTVRYYLPAQSAVRVVPRPIFQNPIVGFHPPAPIMNTTVYSQPMISAPIMYGPITFDAPIVHAPIVTEFSSPNSFQTVMQPEVIYDSHVEPTISNAVIISDEGGVTPATFNEPTTVVPTSVEPVPVKAQPVPAADANTLPPGQSEPGSAVTEKSILDDGS